MPDRPVTLDDIFNGKDRRLWHSQMWAEELSRVLINKGVIEDHSDRATDIAAEAQLLFEEAMQYAAEGGIV